MTLKIIATYTHGTNKYWCYEHRSDLGIFKFWMPHTKRVEGTDRYQSPQPPRTMDMHVEFERDAEGTDSRKSCNCAFGYEPGHQCS